jgi:tryptophanyl-tRNA synthetase
LFEEPDAIAKKVKKAVTDADGIVAYDPVNKPGVSSLLDLLAAATNGSPATLAEQYTRYGDLKNDVAEALIALISPMRERYFALMSDETELRMLLARGAEKADSVASATYARAATAMGLLER